MEQSLYPEQQLILPGHHVPVYSIVLARRPFIEGRAQIVSPIADMPGWYRVRFGGEGDRQRSRLVLPGMWRDNPDQMLEALLAYWRLSVDPALSGMLFDTF